MSGSEALERLERMEEHYRSALARVEAAEAGGRLLGPAQRAA